MDIENSKNVNGSDDSSDEDDWVPDFSTDGPTLAKPIQAKFTNQDYKKQLQTLESKEIQFHQRFQQFKAFDETSKSTEAEINNLNNLHPSTNLIDNSEKELISGVNNWKKYYEQDDMEILYDPIEDIKLEDRYTQNSKKSYKQFLNITMNKKWKDNLDSFGALNCSYCFARFSYSNYAAISYARSSKDNEPKIEGFVVEKTTDMLLLNTQSSRISDSNIEWYTLLAGLNPRNRKRAQNNNNNQAQNVPNKNSSSNKEVRIGSEKYTLLEEQQLDNKKLELEKESPELVFDVSCKSCLKQVGLYYFDKNVYFLYGAIDGIG